MGIKKYVLAAFLMSALCATAHDGVENGDTTDVFEGEVFVETNYGHKYYDNHRALFDFPHIALSGTLQTGHGFSVVAEFEYERFRENSEWGNSFKENFATNKLYVNKAFSKALNLKGGIIDVPVGLTNTGGAALTIYDPESEAGLLPMTWHETGVSLWGEWRDWRYEVSALAYLDLPFKRSGMLGMSFRTDYYGLAEGLRMGVSGYWGKSSCGMVGRCKAGDFVGTDGAFFGAFDCEYVANGWIVDGSAILCSDENAQSAGGEVGYDFASLFGDAARRMSFIPFVRYDGVFADAARNKLTVGANISPLPNLVFKAEYSSRRVCGMCTENTIDVGVSYVLDI